MCGIVFSLRIAKNDEVDENQLTSRRESEGLLEANCRRGPDYQSEHTVRIPAGDATVILTFFSTVLHLRGEHLQQQPVIHSNGDVLCWNGEIFGGINVPSKASDTTILFQELEKIEARDGNRENATLEVFNAIEGPFAFIFYESSRKKLWFGRDCLGRRSLLASISDNVLDIASVTGNAASRESKTWTEMSASEFKAIDVSRIAEQVQQGKFQSIEDCIECHAWKDQSEAESAYALVLPFSKVNQSIPTNSDHVVNDPKSVPELEPSMVAAVNTFEQVLGEAVRSRVVDVPRLRQTDRSAARVAILFSGGIDCLCLAALASRYLNEDEAIDLLNVAFENPRTEAQQVRQKKDNIAMPFDVPDRLTGRAGVKELRRIAPRRRWNFVEINVPFAEATNYRQHIVDLMYPLDSVMDLSIAMAFWFAARGKGVIREGEQMIEYQSKARVLLSGLGADEQLGGYSRHREAFRQGKWAKLINEIQLDVSRISTRNLGRDDRIMSDHGKEVRFPFLSNHVVATLCALPIHLKMDMRYERGIGEKLLLRHLARQLGLVQGSHNWKRAIQFGAKTARMTVGQSGEKGSDAIQ